MSEASDPFSTWRAILQAAIRDSAERQRIAHALQVNPVTLGRWIHQTSQPRLTTLRLLPTVIPTAQARLRIALEQEFPTLFQLAPAGSEDSAATLVQDAPPLDFLLQVCEVAASTPQPVYRSLLPEMVVQQTLKQLDPHHVGLLVEVALCVPAVDGEPVRTLFVNLGRGTPPFRDRIDQVAYLVGAESLMGMTVQSMHSQTNSHLETPASISPGYAAPGEQSAVAAPLLRAGRIAGCLCASSHRAEHFTPAHHTALTRYAQVLALLLDESLFVEHRQIHLSVVPHVQEQQDIVRHFWPHVTALLQARETRTQPPTLAQAERLVLQQMERDLLTQALRDTHNAQIDHSNQTDQSDSSHLSLLQAETQEGTAS